MQSLAKRAGLNKSALVGIVDQLEAKGLAARDRSTSDRRRNRVTVTLAGEAAMQGGGQGYSTQQMTQDHQARMQQQQNQFQQHQGQMRQQQNQFDLQNQRFLEQLRR